MTTGVAVYRMIRLALSAAVAWRYIEYNPAEHAALPREIRKGLRQSLADRIDRLVVITYVTP
jgi:hypothetical protein